VIGSAWLTIAKRHSHATHHRAPYPPHLTGSPYAQGLVNQKNIYLTKFSLTSEIKSNIVQNMNAKANTLSLPRSRKVDVGKALELRLRGYSYQDIANRFKCQKSTVCQALQKFLKLLDNPDLVNAYKQHEADILAAAKSRIVTRIIEPSVLKKASVNNLAYAFTQLNQAERLSRGQSTQNIDIHSQIEKLSGKLSKIEDEERELRRELGISKNETLENL